MKRQIFLILGMYVLLNLRSLNGLMKTCSSNLRIFGGSRDLTVAIAMSNSARMMNAKVRLLVSVSFHDESLAHRGYERVLLT